MRVVAFLLLLVVSLLVCSDSQAQCRSCQTPPRVVVAPQVVAPSVGVIVVGGSCYSCATPRTVVIQSPTSVQYIQRTGLFGRHITVISVERRPQPVQSR